MVTVKDIDTKRFEQAKPGYRPDEVDSFLKEVSASFKLILKEKEETEEKMNKLILAVKKYKDMEDDLKNAMILAQKQSREITAEAQQKAEQIIADANVKSDEIVSSSSVRLEQNREALLKLRREVSDFRTNLLNMYRDHLNIINNIPEFDEEDEYDAQESVPGDASAVIDESAE